MDVARSWYWEELDPEAAKSPEVRKREEREALEAAIREAYQHGVAEGLAKGTRRAESRLASIHRALSGMIEEFGGSVDAWGEAVSDSMAAIATAIARQILERELSTSPEIINELIGTALESFPVDHAIRIRVSPRDLEVLRASGVDDELTRNRWAQWTVEETLSPGSFLIEGPENIIDGRIDHALENLYRRMVDA